MKKKQSKRKVKNGERVWMFPDQARDKSHDDLDKLFDKMFNIGDSNDLDS